MNHHAVASKLLNVSWDSESDDITREAKSIYESGFYAALNLCLPILRKAEEDYRKLAVTAEINELDNLKNDALETADYLKKFLEGGIYE